MTAGLEGINSYKFKVLPQMMKAAEDLHFKLLQDKKKRAAKVTLVPKKIKRNRLQAFRERHKW